MNFKSMCPSGTVTEPKEIFQALLKSRNTGAVIGIRSSPLEILLI
jgi:hypothetical protein